MVYRYRGAGYVTVNRCFQKQQWTDMSWVGDGKQADWFNDWGWKIVPESWYGTAELKARPPYAVWVRGTWSRGRLMSAMSSISSRYSRILVESSIYLHQKVGRLSWLATRQCTGREPELAFSRSQRLNLYTTEPSVSLCPLWPYKTRKPSWRKAYARQQCVYDVPYGRNSAQPKTPP